MFSKESEDTARSAYDLITRTDGKRGSRAVATRGTYAQGVGLFIVVVAGWLAEIDGVQVQSSKSI